MHCRLQLKRRRVNEYKPTYVVFMYIDELGKQIYDQTLRKYYHAMTFVSIIFQELKNIQLENFWNPLLYIDNILNETKDSTWLTATVNNRGEAYVLERRRVKGVFLENLELNDFPLDVQVSHLDSSPNI